MSEAYQFRTHGEITRRAFERSEGLAAYLAAVGIDPQDTFTQPRPTPFNQLARYVNTGTPRDWMIEGVIREDDYKVHPGIETFLGCEPPTNPPSTLDRPLNHFFDVQRGGRGLFIPRVTSGFPAPDWALGEQGRGPGGNEYSLPDARRYQTLSLVARSRQERDINTANLFRTLGHVIHLLQDVAQPQHTRHDPHSGCVEPIGGHSSWFERYIETRALKERFRSRGVNSADLKLDSYSPVKLASYRAYWSGFRGLADFSSRNFVTAGTNLNDVRTCVELLAPPCRPDAFKEENRPFRIPVLRGRVISGTVRVLVYSFVDTVTQELLRADVTSRSVWDEHLEFRSAQPKLTLNTINYDSNGDILIPRAVGYSAGLLDRFFRASVGADVDFDGINIYNATPGETMAGHFSLLHENPDGVRELLGAFLLTIEAESHARVGIPRKLPPNPPPGTRCWLVFQGMLGDERDVVAGRETGCPIEVPPLPQGGEWAVYQCKFVPYVDQPGGARPEQFVYYLFGTQSWTPMPDGPDPILQFNRQSAGGSTACWLAATASFGSGGPPPDVHLDHPF